jgi:hypothetical protein
VTTPVLYVGGSARSGSTLLERMLARIPGYCSVGEVVFIWERGLKRNDRCGCGERFLDCEFWTRVGDGAFGGWQGVDVDAFIRLRAEVDRHRNLDRLSGLRKPGTLAPAMSAYAEITDSLYRAIAEVSGAPVIIDSSKHVSYALVLRDLGSVELRLVHLVRRSHGVAYSWSKRVTKPDVGDGTTYMSVHSSSWSMGLWVADNLLYEALARRVPLATCLRYEDLVAEPRRELERIGRELALPLVESAFGFVDDTSIVLPSTHALSGNPMRSRESVVLRDDDEWRTAMSKVQRASISVATWPLLKHYGYVDGVARGAGTRL